MFNHDARFRFNSPRPETFSILTVVALKIIHFILLFLWLTPLAAVIAGPLRPEAYVWQRTWNGPVRDAVMQHAPAFAGLVVLKAEVSWRNGQPEVARVAVDYATLTNAPKPAGFALRIGAFAGLFATNDSQANFLADLAASLVAEARTNHLPLAELQIDFDCATAKLGGYKLWLAAIRRKISPVPLTITVLPSWLDAPDFKPLAALSPNYVLQVHSLERPTDFAAPFTLCDPLAARQAVERAGQIGVPFRVALPTYGYVMAFNRAGKFISLSAEGPRKDWPAGVQLREVRADPVALAALVQAWTTNRPAALNGVIWYRLPVVVDNLNWRWPTLGAILAGHSPRESLRATTRRVEPGLVEISLANDGELDHPSRLVVEVRWSNARLVAGDGLRDFELAEQKSSVVKFQTRSSFSRLPAGETQTIGWLRFDHDCEVQIELEKN